METEFQQSDHVTYEKAPRITDLNGAYNVVERVRNRLRSVVRGP